MATDQNSFPFKKETYEIIGICMDVHRILGHGFLENVYKDAIEIELGEMEYSFERERQFLIDYKGKFLRHRYNADFVILDKIILKVKASENGLAGDHIAQTLNYLKVSGCAIGLLINFGRKSLEYRRLIY